MKINVIRSAVIEAPIERVWAVLRDFNSHHRWHPAVASSQMENDLDGDVVGSVRRFGLVDGTELREQLLHHSDHEFTMTYSILDSPLPLLGYVATLHLKPVTDGNQTFWYWHSEFRAPEDRASELENLVGQQIYEAGFIGLRTFLAEKVEPSRVPFNDSEMVEVEASTTGQHLPSMAVVVAVAGGPEVMSLRDEMVPTPAPHQVRIRQTAIAVNAIDLKHRRGLSSDFDLPGIPGMEGVGEVIDVGEQVNGLFTHDRVAYMNSAPGAYTDIRCIDADACIPLPDGISDIEASMLLKGVTVALLLSRVFRVVSGTSILIQSVSSDLGHLLSQWAKSMGLTVIGTVSTTEKAKFSRDHGCDHPIVVADGKLLVGEVMRITNGRGVDYWVHSNGAHEFNEAITCLSRCGHCATIGNHEDQPISLDINLLKKRSLTVSAPVCFDYFKDRLYRQRIAHQLFTKILNRTIIPAIQTFPLSQVTEAHSRIEAGQTMGAVVLTPGM